MAVFLAILKILGLTILFILLFVLLLLALVLFVPVRYSFRGENPDSFRYGYVFSWLFRVVQFRKGTAEKQAKLYLFGIDLQGALDFFHRKKNGQKEEYKEYHVEESKVSMVDDFYDEAQKNKEKREQEFRNMSVETDYEDDREEAEEKEDTTEKKNKKKGWKSGKKSFSIERISSIISFVRENETKSAIRKVKKELADLLRYVAPKYVQARILFGTGDPCTTGWVLGAVSMLPFCYEEGVDIRVDFEEKKFRAEGVMKGRIRVFYLVRLAIRCYFDEELKRVWYKVRKL